MCVQRTRWRQKANGVEGIIESHHQVSRIQRDAEGTRVEAIEHVQQLETVRSA